MMDATVLLGLMIVFVVGVVGLAFWAPGQYAQRSRHPVDVMHELQSEAARVEYQRLQREFDTLIRMGYRPYQVTTAKDFSGKTQVVPRTWRETT